MTRDESSNDLESLPLLEPSRALSDSARREGLGAFRLEHELKNEHPAVAFLYRGTRALGVAALAGTVAVYLSWAVQAANALVH